MPLLQPRWRFLLALLLVFLLMLWPLYALLQDYYLNSLSRKNNQTLDLVTANLTATLERYEVLPQILGRLPELRQALQQPHSNQLNQANLLLTKLQRQTGADVIYLLDAQGMTLAASNWQDELSFVGNNFAFRPYFYQALAGQAGEFFGLGNISLKRGYYYGSPVLDGDKVIGVLVVKVDLDFSEQLWGQQPERLMVTDNNGVVILTSEADWRFRATRELSPEQQQAIAKHQPYSSLQPKPLALEAKQWLVFARQLDKPNWEVSIRVPRQQLTEQVRTAMAVFATTALVLILLLGLLMQRRRHYLERIALDAKAKQELEGNVQRRTNDLQQLNSRLKAEVLEREATQQELLRTQDELVQAGKLSALGIMSASISHELNQPLAAIRSYTDNTKVLLDKQRYADVSANLALVAQLTERMASIIAHLRAFARRNPQGSEHVALQPAIDDSLALLAARGNALQIEIKKDIPEATLWVEAGETRLRQVIGNLLSNALDALAEKAMPRIIVLQTSVADGWVCLTIRDNGAGFSQEALQQAREPFYTSKTTARGLGLGLAICDAIVKALQGRLEFTNHQDGGASVQLYLRQINTSEQQLLHEDRFA